MGSIYSRPFTCLYTNKLFCTPHSNVVRFFCTLVVCKGWWSTLTIWKLHYPWQTCIICGCKTPVAAILHWWLQWSYKTVTLFCCTCIDWSRSFSKWSYWLPQTPLQYDPSLFTSGFKCKRTNMHSKVLIYLSISVLAFLVMLQGEGADAITVHRCPLCLILAGTRTLDTCITRCISIHREFGVSASQLTKCICKCQELYW